MDDTMDIDIDLEVDGDYGQAAEEVMVAEPQAGPAAELQADDDIPEAYKEDFDANFPAKEKVYICGLDHVAQPLIEEFIAEHVTDTKHRRLEWIDDNSANIIYHRAEDAAAALSRLSVAQDTLPPPSELRAAKQFTARPDLQFSVRQALVSDKKKPGAKDRSAFYLFNPEWDPENRKYDKRYDRRGRGGRDGQRNGERRGRPRNQEAFTEDMYDDAPAAQAMDERDLARRMSSTSISSDAQEIRRRRRNENGDLFARGERRDAGRLRERSRSPERDEDGRYGFGEDQPRRRTARRRSWTPPSKRSAPDARANNAGKELFEDRAASSSSTPLSAGNRGLELFPNHSAKRSRELFPHRTAHSNHRRTDALDRQETDAILKPNTRSLAERITGGPAQSGVRGRGAIKANDGFSIRGAGDGQSGFSILGASKELNPKVKELFPDRVATASNAGKELFPARGGPRRRAEDLLD